MCYKHSMPLHGKSEFIKQSLICYNNRTQSEELKVFPLFLTWRNKLREVEWLGLDWLRQSEGSNQSQGSLMLSIICGKRSYNSWCHTIANLRTRETRFTISCFHNLFFRKHIQEAMLSGQIRIFIFLSCNKVFQLGCSTVVTWKTISGISCFWQFQVTLGWNMTYSSHPQGNSVGKVVETLINS